MVGAYRLENRMSLVDGLGPLPTEKFHAWEKRDYFKLSSTTNDLLRMLLFGEMSQFEARKGL